MSTVGASGPAPRHSPTTIGWPGVRSMAASRPASRMRAASHSAARCMSGWCSLRALMLGMRRNSNSSSRKRPRFASMWAWTSLISIVRCALGFEGARRRRRRHAWRSARGQLADERVRAVDVAQRFQDAGGMHADGAARLRRAVEEYVRQALDVAVEDEADDARLAVDHRAAAVAARDVVGRDEVERRAHVDGIAALGERPGQRPGHLVAELG